MIELNMFSRKYFSILVFLGILISFPIGSYIFLTSNMSSLLSYTTFFLVILYAISNVIFSKYDKYFYILYIVFTSIILYNMALYLTATFTLFVVAPTYFYLERMNFTDKYLLLKKIRKRYILSKKDYNLNLFMFIAIFLMINYVFYKSNKMEYMYDLVSLLFLVLTFINTVKNNHLQWIYRCLHYLILLFCFNMYNIDKVLIVTECFTVYLSLVCFFSYTYEKEYREKERKFKKK